MLCFFQLKEEIAAKEEEESNNKPKGKEEKKEKRGNDAEVRSNKCIQFVVNNFTKCHLFITTLHLYVVNIKF